MAAANQIHVVYICHFTINCSAAYKIPNNMHIKYVHMNFKCMSNAQAVCILNNTCYCADLILNTRELHIKYTLICCFIIYDY